MLICIREWSALQEYNLCSFLQFLCKKAIAVIRLSVLELLLIFIRPLKPYWYISEATWALNMISTLDILNSIQTVIYITIIINYTTGVSRTSE